MSNHHEPMKLVFRDPKSGKKRTFIQAIFAIVDKRPDGTPFNLIYVPEDVTVDLRMYNEFAVVFADEKTLKPSKGG